MKNDWVSQYLQRMEQAAKNPDGCTWGLPYEPCFGLESHMDADNLAVFLARQFRKVGLKTRFVAVSQDAEKPFHHVYVEVWYPDGKCWLKVDPIGIDALGKPYAKKFGWKLKPGEDA